ncbi:uncharacterized protein CTRU02_203762 [Colletotrichum truncatum]|uniref:Uncharacterized protein n=1 Tax=Colletotrichum truncatum TaxID=5467 RepID=A0ACC3ZA92_COLTU|nr:uncharacterized protein CTRU02_04094 [Colletotrichum truncatum]KAF6796133.1 hypothetical protein CTRU02_04094 [Colletotrichum truncatum]
MPPKKNADNQPAGALNEAESRFVKSMFDHMVSRPDINWDEVGEDLGMTAKSAKERFRTLSKRHNWSGNGSIAGGGGNSPSGKAKGTLGPKNANKVAKKATPKKKGVARKKTKAEPAESDNDEDVSAKLESDSDGKGTDNDQSMDSVNEDEV